AAGLPVDLTCGFRRPCAPDEPMFTPRENSKISPIAIERVLPECMVCLLLKHGQLGQTSRSAPATVDELQINVGANLSVCWVRLTFGIATPDIYSKTADA